MKIHQCVQGTPEWLMLRCGVPTASNFDRIVTPTGKLSTQAEVYRFELLAERMMGHPCEQFISTWMQRGTENESRAVSFYEMLRDADTAPVGFISNDAGTIGASPDRLVGASGLLEIKVPKDGTHVGYLLGKGADDKYKPQVQGQLWIAEREWSDVLSWHPEMPEALIRVARDEKFIQVLSAAVLQFSAELEAQSAGLEAKGWIKRPEPVVVDESLDAAFRAAHHGMSAEQWARSN